MKGARILKGEEFEDYFSFIDKIFNFKAKNLNLNWVHGAFAANKLKNHLVIEEDGKIVSNVSVFPCPVLIRGVRLKMGDIGSVATEEKYRGKGFMSSLLKNSLEMMAREGYDLSTLAGARDRYGRWGWEVAGEERVYTIDRRSIRAVEDTTGMESWLYTRESSDLEKIAQLHERELIKTPRSRQKYRFLFNNLVKKTMEVWLAAISGIGSSYLVLDRQSEKAATVIEYGGNPQVFKKLLRIFIDGELESIAVLAPSYYTPFTPVLTEISREYQIHPLRMLRIISLENILAKQCHLIEEKLSKIDFPSFSLSLIVSDTGQQVTLEFDKVLKLHNAPGAYEVTLDQRSMVRLLFGPGKAGRIFGFKGKTGLILDTLFPLDFYIWRLDCT